MSAWDRRQLVLAMGKLRLAARQTELALERLDGPNSEASLRVLLAFGYAEQAGRELRRFARRHGEDCRSGDSA